MQPQRGASVVSASAQDAQALYDARAALEVLLVTRFVESADQAAVDRLTVAVFELGVVADSGSDAAAVLAARFQLDDLAELDLAGLPYTVKRLIRGTGRLA